MTSGLVQPGLFTAEDTEELRENKTRLRASGMFLGTLFKHFEFIAGNDILRNSENSAILRVLCGEYPGKAQPAQLAGYSAANCLKSRAGFADTDNRPL